MCLVLEYQSTCTLHCCLTYVRVLSIPLSLILETYYPLSRPEAQQFSKKLKMPILRKDIEGVSFRLARPSDSISNSTRRYQKHVDATTWCCSSFVCLKLDHTSAFLGAYLVLRLVGTNLNQFFAFHYASFA
jgi:hypothetical protein